MIKEDIKRGEIYKVDLPLEDNGCVQKGTRPCLIVQNDRGNKYSTTILVVPITSKQKTKLPTHVVLDKELTLCSTVLCEHIMTISKNRIRQKLGEVGKEKMKEINKALTIELDLY